MAGPLSHLRVVDFTRLLPGPFCTLMLADLGARVIKVEDVSSPDFLRSLPPQRDGRYVGFSYLHRGQRGLALDMRSPRAGEILRRVIGASDVLVESFRPGVMHQMGLGYADLCESHPRLIYCSLTGYGQEGPLARRAGHDINYLARSGVASMVAGLSGVQIADLSGALLATTAILAALASGSGQLVDVSMTDACMSLLSIHAAAALFSGTAPTLGQGIVDGGVPAYRYYRCADGKQVAVGALEPKFWNRLCDLLEVPHYRDDGLAQGERGREVQQALERIFGSRTQSEWVQALGASDVCVEPVLDLLEAFRSEHGRARGMLVENEGLPQPGCPLPMGGGARGAAPGLGEHNQEILTEVGYSAADIESLRARSVIA